jgi:hypothetical protein
MPAQPNPERDEPVAIPLDPEEALRALLAVKPDEVPKDEKKGTRP